MSAERFPHITELVPHVAPMLALDELTAWEPGHAAAIACVRADHYLARGGAPDGSAALELMAQTVAACMGMEAFRHGEPVRYGMVIACRSLALERPELAVGERYAVDVRRVRSTDYASHFDGEVRDARGELVASGSFTLVHGDAPPE